MTAKKLTRDEFAHIWNQAASLKDAATALEMKVRSATRRANRLRAAGWALKTLTDQRFNQHACTREQRPLTTEERAFMGEHFAFARGVAWNTCRSMELPPQWLDDVVEDAATEALGYIARRSTEPGFVAATAKGLVVTAVRGQVRAMARKVLGPVRPRSDILGFAAGRSPTPLQEVVAREDGGRTIREDEAAARLIGGMPDTSRRRESGARKEYLSLRAKALGLGLDTTGTADELRERLAAHYRAQLVRPDRVVKPHSEQRPAHEQPVEQETSPSAMPNRVRHLLTAAPPKSRQQTEAERFLFTWYQSSTVADVARTLNWSVRSVQDYIRRLRMLGVPGIKHLPTTAAPLVRAVLSFTPSNN